MHLDRKAFPKYFVLQSLHKALPSITLYYKVCTKHVPVLLLVLQSLHKVFPSTSVYYKACTKHVQYYYLYYKACTKHFPVLLCTTKLAQSTSQYYFVQQAGTKHVPALLCTTKLAQSTSQYYFVIRTHKHTQSSLKPPLQCGKKKANRPQPHPPHTGGTFHRRLQLQGFVLRLPPQNKAHATFMQPLQCVSQHSVHHHFPSSPLPLATTSQSHHFPSSPLPFVTTSLRHHPVS